MAFSCRGRGLCPSCGAKRAAELAAFLIDEVVEDVGHAQWVFTVPKMLRVYFLYHRELLGESVASGLGDGEGAHVGGGWGGEGLSPRGGVDGADLRGPGELPPARARAGHSGRLDELGGVDRGAVRGRASGGGAVPSQGAEAASAARPAERGADRASSVVAPQRLLRAQSGLRTSCRRDGTSRAWCVT